MLSSIQPEICMYFLRQEITPFTTYYPQNAILYSFFLNATRCSLTSARIFGAGISSQFHGGVLWQAHAPISCFVPRRRRTRRGLRGETGYTCSGVLRLLLRVCCFRLRGFPRLLPSLLLALHLRLSLRVCFSSCVSQFLSGVDCILVCPSRLLRGCCCARAVYFLECSLPPWTSDSPSGQESGLCSSCFFGVAEICTCGQGTYVDGVFDENIVWIAAPVSATQQSAPFSFLAV